jgi:ankyrin repeat protein
VENYISKPYLITCIRAPFVLTEHSSPLQIAVARGMLNIVRILVAYRADPEYCSAGTWSMFHYFFDRGRSINSTEYAAVLGEDLSFDDIKDTQGWTALHRCAAFGTAKDIYLLHRLGASARPEHYVDNWGWTPVHVAALMNNISTLEALVDLAERTSGHDPDTSGVTVSNLVDIHGWSPLHLAVHRRAMDTTKWLLLTGGDPQRRTYRTAGWFPQGYEGQDFDAAGLARMSGEKCLIEFVHLMRDTGYDVTTDGKEVYW